MENPGNIVILLQEAGDQNVEVSDNEELAQDMDSAFEPAETLEVEKDVEKDDIFDAAAPTSDAVVDDISESNDDLTNPKPARKRRKITSKKQQKRTGYNQYLNSRGDASPHRELSSHHRDFNIPLNGISALFIKSKHLDNKTEKWLSAPIHPKFRPNTVPNCGKDIFICMVFWSSIEFGGKKP